MPVAELSSRLPEAWSAAIRHRFLTGVQDAHFVGHLLWFQTGLLARAPRSTQAVLEAGAVALVDERTWFDAQATPGDCLRQRCDCPPRRRTRRSSRGSTRPSRPPR